MKGNQRRHPAGSSVSRQWLCKIIAGIYLLRSTDDKENSGKIAEVPLDASLPSPYRTATEFLQSVTSGGLGRLLSF